MNEHEQAFLERIIEHDEETLNTIVAEHFRRPHRWPGSEFEHGTLIVPKWDNPKLGGFEQEEALDVITGIARLASDDEPAKQRIESYVKDVFERNDTPIDPGVFETYSALCVRSIDKEDTLTSTEQNAVYGVLERALAIVEGHEENERWGRFADVTAKLLMRAGGMRPVNEEKLVHAAYSALPRWYRLSAVTALRYAELFDEALGFIERVRELGPVYSHASVDEVLAEQREFVLEMKELHEEFAS